MKQEFSFEEAARPAALLTMHRLFRFFFSLRGFFRHALPLLLSWAVCAFGAWNLWQYGAYRSAPFLKTLGVALGCFAGTTVILVFRMVFRPFLRARSRRGDPAPLPVRGTMDETAGFAFRTPDGMVRRYRWSELDRAEIFRRMVFLIWIDHSCLAIPRRALGREGVRMIREKAPSPAPTADQGSKKNGDPP